MIVIVTLSVTMTITMTLLICCTIAHILDDVLKTTRTIDNKLDIIEIIENVCCTCMCVWWNCPVLSCAL